uniref:Exostosin GT47 domain-containing protein n=1 Tax=Haptolina brevifila TaxID=156173 RepID=A0A7S2H812_9EUKA|mmetsp:Transcript_52051/g.103580  ORF Transcript_52051/g.103580 Transcript_52051/m.103580 type:complete len:167 (+) Transcript_52051:112-612(+)
MSPPTQYCHLFSPTLAQAFNPWAPLHLYTSLALICIVSFCLTSSGLEFLCGKAIIDAAALGCIPVFFHPAQPSLWPLHWNASLASITFDWTTVRAAKWPAQRASKVFHQLSRIPRARVSEMRRVLRGMTSRLTYRGEDARHAACRRPNSPDAIDILVQWLQNHHAR